MDENPEEVVTVDTNTDVEEATDSNEVSEQEDTEALKEELEKERIAKSQILARARKAEDELKTFKANPPIKNDPQLSEELKLIARGLSDEEIEQAKVIAKGKDIVLTEAIKDPLFTIFQSDLKEKQRKENAKLGASKGSGESIDSTLIKADMTEEEHKEAFKKVMGKVTT
jgi:hypothetical protein